jgi:hypothetical protein
MYTIATLFTKNGYRLTKVLDKLKQFTFLVTRPHPKKAHLVEYSYYWCQPYNPGTYFPICKTPGVIGTLPASENFEIKIGYQNSKGYFADIFFYNTHRIITFSSNIRDRDKFNFEEAKPSEYSFEDVELGSDTLMV